MYLFPLWFLRVSYLLSVTFNCLEPGCARICHDTVFPCDLYIYHRRSVNFRTEAPGGHPAASTPLTHPSPGPCRKHTLPQGHPAASIPLPRAILQLAHPSPGPSCSKHAPPQGCSAAAFTLAVCTSYQSDPHPGPSPLCMLCARLCPGFPRVWP